MSLIVTCDVCGKNAHVKLSAAGTPILPEGWIALIPTAEAVPSPRSVFHSCGADTCEIEEHRPEPVEEKGEPSWPTMPTS